jgi:uncharacterized membrane protein
LCSLQRHHEARLTAASTSAQYLPVAAGGQPAPRNDPVARATATIAPIWLFAFAHFLVLTVSAGFRHFGGQSNFYDLGVMDNIVWQTIHGRLLFYPQYEMSYFGDHFAPILLLFVPLYALWAHPLVLIGGQALAFAVGNIFVYRIALVHLIPDPAGSVLEPLPARRAAWALTLVYAFHPSLLYIAMFDFHPVALMIPLSLAVYFCYVTNTRIWLVVSLVLLAACQEEAAITVAAFGLYMLAFGRSTSERWIGAVTSVAAVLYLSFVMKLIIPAFQTHPTVAGWTYLSRYAHLGRSISGIVRTIAFHPLDALAASFELYKLETLALLFVPLGLLPLLGWRALLVALPSLGYTYLSARPNQFVIQHQYFSPALGWLVVAAVQGLRAWVELWRRPGAADFARRRRRVIVVLPLAVALLATVAVDFHRKPIKPHFFRQHPYRAQLAELQRIIAPDSSLAVTNNLAPFFAHRREFVLALDITFNRELNTALGLPDYRDTAFHLFDLTALGASQDRERRVAQLLTDHRYGVRYYQFPLVLFERGFPRRAQPELEALIVGNGDGSPGVVRVFPAVLLEVRDAGSVQRHLGDAGRGATLRFVPGRHGRAVGSRVSLPSGSYTVDFYLKLEEPTVGPVADFDVLDADGRRRHAGRSVAGADFTAADRCQPFALRIDLKGETAELDFRARSHGAAFSLCKIVVRRPEQNPN